MIDTYLRMNLQSQTFERDKCFTHSVNASWNNKGTSHEELKKKNTHHSVSSRRLTSSSKALLRKSSASLRWALSSGAGCPARKEELCATARNKHLPSPGTPAHRNSLSPTLQISKGNHKNITCYQLHMSARTSQNRSSHSIWPTTSWRMQWQLPQKS